MRFSLILRVLVPFLYLVVTAGYIQGFVRNKGRLSGWVRPFFGTAVGAHTLMLALLFLAHGFFPFGTVVRGLFFFSWVLAVLFYSMEKVLHDASYGAFSMPLLTAVAGLTAFFLDRGVPLPEPMMSYYFVIHVTALFSAYACFCFSFILSIMYLLQHREIKTRRPGPFFDRLPPLESMDHAVKVMDAMGLCFTVLGIITGFLWLDAFNMAVSANIPVKAGFIVITFVIYLSEHLLRIGKGWSGQRACLVSIAGFLMVLCTLIVGRHGY